jgi:hypothetical protein
VAGQRSGRIPWRNTVALGSEAIGEGEHLIELACARQQQQPHAAGGAGRVRREPQRIIPCAGALQRHEQFRTQCHLLAIGGRGIQPLVGQDGALGFIEVYEAARQGQLAFALQHGVLDHAEARLERGSRGGAVSQLGVGAPHEHARLGSILAVRMTGEQCLGLHGDLAPRRARIDGPAFAFRLLGLAGELPGVVHPVVVGAGT